MSLTPEQLQKLAQPLIDIYLAIESELLENLARTIAKDKNLLVTTEDGQIDYQHWRLVQLNKIGKLTNENIKILSQYSGATVKEINKMIKDAGYQSIAADDEIYQKAIKQDILAPLETPESIALGNILLAYQKQAIQTFNLVNTTMLEQSKQIYLDTINQSVGKMLSGSITADQAIRETVQEWSKTGIPALIDKKNRKWTTEAYVSMVARSTSNTVANEMQFARMDDYEVDLIEVSSHLGARPRCEPFQGRVYSKSGENKKYEAWSSTSYGEIAGLLGINCRHVTYPFIEGVSIQRNKPYSKEQNEKVYELQSKQRKLERDIRHAKRELQTMKALGDEIGINKASGKLKKSQSNIRQFINQTGRKRQRNREQIV